MNTDLRPPPYSIRLEPEIRTKLEAIAKKNGRSLSAEIALRLEESLKTDSSNGTESSFTKEQENKLREWIREELAKAGKG